MTTVEPDIFDSPQISTIGSVKIMLSNQKSGSVFTKLEPNKSVRPMQMPPKFPFGMAG